MRKLVGFIFLTLLSVPAVAFAWTAGITVQGPAAGIDVNTVTVNTVPATVVAGGTKYVYPVATTPSLTATVGVKSGYTAAITLDGASVGTTAGDYIITKAAIHNFKVVYTVQLSSVTVTQSAGGKVYVQIGNATSAIGFKNIPAGTTGNVVTKTNTGYTSTSNTQSFVASGTAAIPVWAVFAQTPPVKTSLP